MLGDYIFVSPIVTKYTATTKSVYVPAGAWYNFWTDEIVTGGTNVSIKVTGMGIRRHAEDHLDQGRESICGRKRAYRRHSGRSYRGRACSKLSQYRKDYSCKRPYADTGDIRRQ